MRATTRMFHAAVALRRAQLSSLIAEFDYFIGRFLVLCAELEKEEFYDPDEKITVGELSIHTDFDSLIKSRVDKTISEKLRGSHEALIDWIFKVLNLVKPAKGSDDVIKDFLEVCQRRHLFAHNGGRVNQVYIDKCVHAGFLVRDLPTIGEELHVDDRYLRRAAARVYLTGYFIAQMFIQKRFGSVALNVVCHSMIEASHDFLDAGQTKVARRIIDFAEKSKLSLSNETKLTLGVNKALSCLFNPDLSKEKQDAQCAEILAKYDWSLRSPVFDLALACLRRDFSDIENLCKKAIDDGLTYDQARIWVLFKEAREQTDFLKFFPAPAIYLPAPEL